MKKLDKEEIEKEIIEMEKLNSTLISAAKMVGYDVEVETKKTDNRIQVNIHQKSRIQFLKGLLKEEHANGSK